MNTLINKIDTAAVTLRPERLTDIRSWQGHIPFAFYLVKTLRPKLLVELGTHKGDSYCGFCQAAASFGTNTRCYAVDTWAGDPQAGFYGDDVFFDLKAYHDRKYGHFSTLLRMRFDEAATRFEDHTIDLLHIDGQHSYEAVKYDFLTWLPKMSPRGIVLLHDTRVFEDDFGVWRLLDEVKHRFPVFEFFHSHGLAVIGAGADFPEQIQGMFQAEAEEAAILRDFFEDLGGKIVIPKPEGPVWVSSHPVNYAHFLNDEPKYGADKADDPVVSPDARELTLLKKNTLEQGPRVSVVIPAYNHEAYIMEAVDSVLSQSLDDFELILIDDGSTDRTLEHLKTITDNRISIFTQENQGAAGTINTGIGMARGSYIAILNSDDVFHPDRLKRMSEYLDQHPDIAITSSVVQPIDAEGNRIEGRKDYDYWTDWYADAVKRYREGGSALASLLVRNFVVSTSNIFARASVFKSGLSFNNNLRYCHDYEFLIKAMQIHGFYLFEEPLLNYRLHEQNTILEDVFLRRLEIIFSIFNAVDIPGLQGKTSRPRMRRNEMLQALYENPDINPAPVIGQFQKALEEKQSALAASGDQIKALQQQVDARERKLKQADAWLQKFQQQNTHQDEIIRRQEETIRRQDESIRHKDESIKALSDQAANLNEVLRQKDEQLNRASKDIENLQTALTAKNEMLNEIFSSKGWRWLTRYRRMKEKTFFFLHSKRRGVENNGPSGLPYEARIKHRIRKNRPRILHVIANVMTGGSTRLVLDLIENLGHRYEQEVVTSYIPSPPDYTGFVCHLMAGNDLHHRLSEFLKNNRPDILHIHYWGECDESWYANFFKPAENDDYLVIENINTPVAPFISRCVTRYVYVSHYAMNYDRPIQEKSSVIYPGSDFTLFQRNGAPVPDNTIGMVYRLEKDKLKEDAIEVFIQVAKRRPQTKCYIVGGGTFLASYRDQVQASGTAGNFVFTDYVPYADLPDLYRKFSVFVAPVWKESFGQVSAFAMSMGIPVAGYDVGALFEILGGKEFLGKDVNQLAAIILDLLDDRKKRIKVGRLNHKRAMENFSVEAMITSYDKLYTQLLAGRK